MKKQLLSILIALCCALPVFAGGTNNHLSITLNDLRCDLKGDYQKATITRDRLAKNYETQHKKMVNIMTECNELSLMLYSKKQEFTFDISFILEKVKNEYNTFDKGKMPFERIVKTVDIEIERYARLIEALRILPPKIDSVHEAVDSLVYLNDSLHDDHFLNASELERTIQAIVLSDSITTPFMLDETDRQNRDSCIYYAERLLNMYLESRAIIVADSIHYTETFIRLQDSYQYAHHYYKFLQRQIFVEGQTPWPTILLHFDHYWNMAVDDTKEKYFLDDVDLSLSSLPSEDSSMRLASNRYAYAAQIVLVLLLLFVFLFIWLVSRLLLIPVFCFVKPVKNNVSKQQKPYIALLLGVLFFVLLTTGASHEYPLLSKAFILSNTFIWLLAAIVAALLIRLNADQLKKGIKLYRPLIFTALVVIGCRVLFIPNSMMNIIFPPCLIFFFLWQLITCLRHSKDATKTDRIFSWITLALTGAAMLIALSGYIFASLMILVWWYFQLATILTIMTVKYLGVKYKEKRMNPRITSYLGNITTVTGQDKKSYLFGVTWFYELMKEVMVPLMMMTSIPLCLQLAMNVFDFDDLYEGAFHTPFIQLFNDEGVETFRLSVYLIILLTGLFFIFRYINRAFHAIWQQTRYSRYLRKTHRTIIHKDEVNLTLGNSIISVVVWMTYIVVVVLCLHIPTGYLSLVAGGFSAGIGLAMKDILNNFIYGIQLLSGKLKVGDWIECNGVRGKVVGINYQTTQVETIKNTTVSFLNSTLFEKNFTNLTKGNPYELLTILVGVAYGTDMQRVREVVENAMQTMRTKDEYGREIVDPKYGVYVRLGEFNDSSLSVAVKQYVISSEHVAYADKAKEMIYNALNNNGITIPFPQRDIHIISEGQHSGE